MEDRTDIRWQQRFSNFKKALTQLENFIEHGELNVFEKQGLIKAFEYTYELAWKTLQDLLKEKGYLNITGPKPVIEQAFADEYILDGKEWVRMHVSRNLTSHTYNEEIADEIVNDILNSYFQLFLDLSNRLNVEIINNNKLF